MDCKRFVVGGRVQGVGYRAYVVRLANELGVVGEVWNTRDGDVEIVAGGEDLTEFSARLWHGPGSVRSVVAEQGIATMNDETFVISASR